MLALWRNARLATLASPGAWGWIEDGALVVAGQYLHWVGEARHLPRSLPIAEEHDLGGALVTPGLVDCHTHLVYGGTRADEFEARLHGATYADMARQGGGILSTVRATRAASDEELLAGAIRRARALLAEGVTTVEIKSGYGLTYADEARCLRIARQLAQCLPLTVCTTYLAAHALPPEFAGRPDDYIAEVCAWLPEVRCRSGGCRGCLLRKHRVFS